MCSKNAALPLTAVLSLLIFLSVVLAAQGTITLDSLSVSAPAFYDPARHAIFSVIAQSDANVSAVLVETNWTGTLENRTAPRWTVFFNKAAFVGEDASSYACAGNWSVGHNCSMAYDGNWNTYGEPADWWEGSWAALYMNYTKPQAANRYITWQTLKYYNPYMNGTLWTWFSEGCWNQSQLILKINDTLGVKGYCWNGQEWEPAGQGNNAIFYEEAIYWGVDYYNYSHVLPPGTYQYRFYANDTFGNWNSTAPQTFTISMAPSVLNLSLDGVQGNVTVMPNTTVNVTAFSPNAESDMTVWRNSTVLVSGKSPLFNLSAYDSDTNITVTQPGTQNYSEAAPVTFWVLMYAPPPSSPPPPGNGGGSGGYVPPGNSTNNTSAASGSVSFSLAAEPASLNLDYNESANVTLRISNTGTAHIDVSFIATGVPADWVSGLTPLSIAANEMKELELVVIGKEPGNWTLAVTASAGSVGKSVSVPLSVAEGPQTEAGAGPTGLFALAAPALSEEMLILMVFGAVAVALLCLFTSMMRREEYSY